VSSSENLSGSTPAKDHARAGQFAMAEVCPAELANMQVAAIPLRNVDYPMQTVTATAKVGCKNQLVCRSLIQERHARHHRVLMAMNDIGAAQMPGQKRIHVIEPEPPKVDPVSQHLDIEFPTTFTSALRPECDECRRNSFRHGTAQSSAYRSAPPKTSPKRFGAA
jgi:hypothetical protein